MEDDTDEDLIRTALRETQEEIGLAENAVDIWGQLPPLPGRVSNIFLLIEMTIFVVSFFYFALFYLFLILLVQNFDVLVTPIVGFCNNVQLDSLPINRHEVRSYWHAIQ